MRRIPSLLFITLFLGGFARAQQSPEGETHRFNLQQCLDYAIENQDSVKNARLDIKKAEYKVKETIGLGLPQVSGVASIQDYLKVPTSLLPGEFFGQPAGTFIPVRFGVKYQGSTAVNVSQLIFDGSYLVGLKASKTYKELSQRNFTRSRINTKATVTKAYYQVLVSGEQLKLLDANEKQLKQQLTETTAQNKQGFVEKIDVDRLSVQYNNLVTNRENTIRSLALNYQLLKFQMGMPVNDNLVILEKIEDIKLDTAAAAQSAAGRDTSAYRKRIEFGLTETQIKLNELNLQRIKSQYLPTLSANGQAAYAFQANSLNKLVDQRFPTVFIGAQLNVPIFNGFQRLNQVRQAKIEVEKARNGQNMLKNGIQVEIDQAHINYQNGLKSLNSQNENMTLAKEVLRVSRIKYQQGVGSSIEVTQAQTDLDTSINNYINALYDVLVSKVDLDKATGTINE
ncbi:MAG: TolC family protein [Mucilaginibacter polytrichastri]|nr:TolC family protein [Mucilaginibacter polytrichastri]